MRLKKNKPISNQNCFPPPPPPPNLAPQRKTFHLRQESHFFIQCYLREDSCQDNLTIGREEEDTPVKSKHVHQLEPGEVFVFGVAHKLAGGTRAFYAAPLELCHLGTRQELLDQTRSPAEARRSPCSWNSAQTGRWRLAILPHTP